MINEHFNFTEAELDTVVNCFADLYLYTYTLDLCITDPHLILLSFYNSPVRSSFDVEIDCWHKQLECVVDEIYEAYKER